MRFGTDPKNAQVNAPWRNVIRHSRAALVSLVLMLGLGIAMQNATGAVTATITQGYPEASPDTVDDYQDTTLNYNVTITGLNPDEAFSSKLPASFTSLSLVTGAFS